MKEKIKRRLNILKFIWNQYKWKTALLFIVSCLNLLIQLSTVAFLLPIIDFMRTQGDIDLTQGYWKYLNTFFTTINVSLSFQNILIACFFFMCIYQIFIYIRLMFTSKIRAEFHCIFQDNVSKSILFGNYSIVTQHRQSSLLNMLLHQTNQSAYFIFALFEYFHTIIQTTLYVGFLFLLSIKLTLLVGTYVLIQLLIVNWRSKTIKTLGQKLSKNSDAMAHHIQEYTSSIKFISILNLQQKAMQILNDSFNAYKATFIKTQQKKFQIEVSQETMHMGFIFIIMYFSFSVWNMSLSKIMLFLFMLTRLIPSLKSYNNHNATLNTYFGYFDKLKRFISDNPVNSTQVQKISKKYSITNIMLKNISFSYIPKKQIINNFTHTFNKNSITAILGESGAGKTTLVDLILGLRQPNQGTIEYKNQNKILSISDISTFYLPQGPIVFAGSVRNYFLKLHSKAVSDEQIIDCLKQVSLWEHFQTLDGLDTIIDEKGSNLSEGQKQRLCLSYVFLNHYALIILDEFTSAIDQQSKEIILTAIKKINNCIIIFITHDKETIECATAILKLEKSTYL